MSYDYGVDLSSPYLNYISHLDFETIKKYRKQLSQTNDILWLDEFTYQSKINKTISEKLKIAFDKDFNIITKLK
ncbi:hypothetical protein HMF3257_16170 [Spirosoma telluris]|uniref:Uncharacterized protein n=2 Tax=Spirosoma telluris TaxID=2183553 RepID=A0A327NMT4_9BACT|nr:hypothetical protein HMF3257_16170 [Spirosoma telluris]